VSGDATLITVYLKFVDHTQIKPLRKSDFGGARIEADFTPIVVRIFTDWRRRIL